MTNDQIKELALKCGFKERRQKNHQLDLSPIVYEFAATLLAAQPEIMQKKYQKLLDKADHLHNYVLNIDHAMKVLQHESEYWKRQCYLLNPNAKPVVVQ